MGRFGFGVCVPGWCTVHKLICLSRGIEKFQYVRFNACGKAQHNNHKPCCMLNGNTWRCFLSREAAALRDRTRDLFVAVHVCQPESRNQRVSARKRHDIDHFVVPGMAADGELPCTLVAPRGYRSRHTYLYDYILEHTATMAYHRQSTILGCPMGHPVEYV